MDKLTRLARIIETYERAREKLESKGMSFGPTEGNGERQNYGNFEL